MLLAKYILTRPRLVALAASLTVTACPLLQAHAADLFESEATPAPSAQNFDQARFGGMRQKLSDWQVIVGGGAMYAPRYEGSDELKVSPVPWISATFGDRVYVDPLGISVDVLQFDGFKLAVKGGYELGRAESDSKYLRGLGDIDAGGVIGGKISYEIGPLEVYGAVDKTIGGSEGLTGTVGANVSYQVDRFMLTAGASATMADEKHMDSYFGVTQAQSAKSGYRRYEASAGLKRVDIEASVTYFATENWFVRGQGGVGFLTGDAKDSPIVRDNIQPSAMLTVGYKF